MIGYSEVVGDLEEPHTSGLSDRWCLPRIIDSLPAAADSRVLKFGALPRPSSVGPVASPVIVAHRFVFGTSLFVPSARLLRAFVRSEIDPRLN